MKFSYFCLRAVLLIALLVWIYVFLIGSAGLFCPLESGDLIGIGLGEGVFFVLGLALCQKGLMVRIYCQNLLRSPTLEESERIRQAKNRLEKKQELSLRGPLKIKKIYIKNGPSMNLEVYGTDTVILPTLLLKCPTEGVLEGSFVYAQNLLKEGVGQKGSLILFLTMLLRGVTFAQQALKRFLYRPMRQKVVKGSPVVFSKDIILLTLGILGILPALMLWGLGLLLRAYLWTWEKEIMRAFEEKSPCSASEKNYYDKYCKFLKAMPQHLQEPCETLRSQSSKSHR